MRDPAAGCPALWGSAVVAPAGNASDMPGVIRLVAVMLLAASNAASVTWLRDAIPPSESPALTV